MEIVAALLTLLVLSRIFGDHPGYRVAQYFFVGVALGISVLALFSRMFREWPDQLLTSTTETTLYAIPLLLGLLLFTRLGGQQISWLANVPLGIIFGVAAALALSGALLGTLMPQLRATVVSAGDATSIGDMIGSWVVLPLGVILVLFSFSYRTREGRSETLREPVRQAGRWLLIISLGVVFAGSMLSYMTALIERIGSLIELFV